MNKRWLYTLLLSLHGSVFAADFNGNLTLQGRSFAQEPLNPAQQDSNMSLAAEPEWFFELDDSTVTLKPFVRIDQQDDERTHGDLREFYWQGVYDDFELTAGINKVFWGVTETQHLVDIINQTDNLENLDGEDKLGQPMIRLSMERDWGVLSVFVLPGFRERAFPGIEGRPRPEILIDGDSAIYESADKNRHIDFAIRWFQVFDHWELGLSHFSGTSREPNTFLPSASSGIFSPYYTIIHQSSLDAQVLIDDWTWKLELINRRNQFEHYNAMTAGFEYTLIGLFESVTDLGVVVEYLYDDRDELANTPFQNDITTGLRWVLNDTQSTEVLAGLTSDLDSSTRAVFVEATRRLNSRLKLDIEIRAFSNTQPGQILYSFRRDNYAQFDLSWYY